MDWTTIASDKDIDTTATALKKNNMNVFVVNDAVEAKKKILELLPLKCEVMTMSSTTLEQTGIRDALEESGAYISIHKKLAGMNRETSGKQMQQLGAAPEWAVGSVHAVTVDGNVLIASNTGSQLPAYAYGAAHVVWVVGAHKIVKNIDEGIKRIYEHALPLENIRAQKAYGVGSAVNKLLIFNKETRPDRVMVILVKQAVGF